VARALAALGAPQDAGAALAWAIEQHPILADLVAAMTRLTVNPTGLRTYEPSNVIPPYADVICDCRALPGQGEDDIREHIDRVLAGIPYELELLEPLEGGTESPTGTVLYRVIEDYVAERLPGALLVPVVNVGFTDSHWIRSARETVAYGFAPVLHTDAGAYSDAAHGADEAIDVADVAEMAEFHLRAIRALQVPGRGCGCRRAQSAAAAVRQSRRSPGPGAAASPASTARTAPSAACRKSGAEPAGARSPGPSSTIRPPASSRASSAGKSRSAANSARPSAWAGTSAA